jgi:hypothetical protein
VIKQGDYLLSIAHQFGFDANTVWTDPANAKLRTLRPDPNILFPGDVLQIPDQQNKQPVVHSLTPNTTNNFVSDVPTVTLTVTLVGPDPSTYASRAFGVVELPALTGLQTSAAGVATFAAPVTLATATLSFPDTGESILFSIGAIDPVDTLSGIFQRLQSLGYIGSSFEFDYKTPSNNLYILRAGLLALKGESSSELAGPPSSDPGSGPASEPPPSSPPPSGSGPASSPGPASGPGSGPPSQPAPGSQPPSGSGPASSPGPASGPGSGPPSEPPPSSGPASAPSAPVGNNAGLADDGTLDAETRSLLIQTYGC